MDDDDDPPGPENEDDTWDAVDEGEDWKGDAASRGHQVDDFDEYTGVVNDHNEQAEEMAEERRREEKAGILDEMFPDGHGDDDIFNREE